MLNYSDPKNIYLDKCVRRTPYVESLLDNFPPHSIHIVDNPEYAKLTAPDSNSLLITNFKGRFLKPCPGTSHYLCCDYQVLNFAAGCLLDCAYCVLQTYLNAPGMILYANIEQMKEEIEEVFKTRKRMFRLGTGELTDSLLLDNKIRFSEYMAPYILQFDNVVLELKTKSVNVDSVKQIKPHPRLVISWSLNSPELAALYESKSPAVHERIEAASSLEQSGYRIGIHFDPLIYTRGWETQYTQTLDMMRAKLKNPAWISMGGFRGPPSLKRVIEKQHPLKPLLLEEFIIGKDGKMRYFRPIRTRMYRFMAQRLKKDFPDTPVYLCMESPEVWKRVFGWSPKNNRELGDWLISRQSKEL